MPNVNEETLVEQGAIPPADFSDKIERIREIAEYDVELPIDFAARLQSATDGLLVSPETLRAAAAGLRAGHIVLQGPPGTGKSSLARAICNAFNASIFPVTAHEDWTVFDLMGRLELRLDGDRKEEIVPINGYFTESVIRCANAMVRHFDEPREPQAEWLLIDEMNRAHLDRAFGELFTVLGSDTPIPITLPHQRQGNRNLVVPRRFRIIATLNSFDRQFVNNLSQAIRRRFTFISVNIPDKRTSTETWTDTGSGVSLAVREFKVVLDRSASRVAKRLTTMDAAGTDAKTQEIVRRMEGSLSQSLEALFNFVERIRYAKATDRVPHLPIGTAQLIDTVELFLLRLMQDEMADSEAGAALDWATSVKLGPLFDSDVVAPEILKEFAEHLTPPFDRTTRRELLSIVAAGVQYVG